jgi:putative membrane protein
LPLPPGLRPQPFHLIFMVTWFAGLFYLPRLFVYHAMSDDEPGNVRFKTMERKLYFGIMMPSLVLIVVCGLGLLWQMGAVWFAQTTWFHVKLALVVVLVAYHFYLGRVVRAFRDDANRRGHVYYRIINEFPVLILVAVVLLAVLKPWGLSQ